MLLGNVLILVAHLFVASRVVSLSLCSGNDCFVSGSLDRTVLLWDQRAEKCQVDTWPIIGLTF